MPNLNIKPDKLYKVHEAAEIFRVGPETVRRWLREGKLGFIRVGLFSRKKLIPGVEIEKVLSQPRDQTITETGEKR